jgi:hypothetical protein
MTFNLIVLKTHDIQQLVCFYELLGLKFEYHKHEGGVWHYATIVNDIVFEIYPLGKNDIVTDKTTRLGFFVENLNEKISILLENNYKIVSYPQQTTYGFKAIVEDYDGRKVELTEK